MARPIKTIDQFEISELAAEQLTDQELDMLITAYSEAEKMLHKVGSMLQGEMALDNLDSNLDSLTDSQDYLLAERRRRCNE